MNLSVNGSNLSLDTEQWSSKDHLFYLFKSLNEGHWATGKRLNEIELISTS